MSKRTQRSDLYVFIGSKIKDSRIDYRRIVGQSKKIMTQTQLANVCGVTFQQIQKYEKGMNKVPIDNLLRIAKATNKDFMFFIPKDNEIEECKRMQDHRVQVNEPIERT